MLAGMSLLKTSETKSFLIFFRWHWKKTFFWRFQGVYQWNIVLKWVKSKLNPSNQSFPQDRERKLNVHKTFKRRPGRLMYIQFASRVQGYNKVLGYHTTNFGLLLRGQSLPAFVIVPDIFCLNQVTESRWTSRVVL